jgi:hypothetical protein
MIQIMRALQSASEPVRCAVDLRPAGGAVIRGPEVFDRGTGLRRSPEEGPPQDRWPR